MVAVYAATADLVAWTGANAPTNVVALLRSASIAVTRACQTAFYATDSNGLPTDAPTLQAFKDATCSQAAAMISLGIDPLSGGVLTAGIEGSVGIGTARVVYEDAAQAAAAKAAASGNLVPEAFDILQEAMIILNIPWVVG